MSKVIFFTFAGREANMEIQLPYVLELLDANPGSEFHLWDMTRQPSDQVYIRDLAATDDRIKYAGFLHTGHPISCLGPHRRGHRRCTCMKHKAPFEQPYRWYASKDHYDDDTVFVKFDDDVLWMDTPRFGEVLEFLETQPNAIASANVTNNAVCAKYEPELRDRTMVQFGIAGVKPLYDQSWWGLHKDAEFAVLSHEWLSQRLSGDYFPPAREPFRTREGEAVSINFIAMKYPVLRKAAGLMENGGRLGDEGTIDSMLPWIVPNFRVAHLTFGPQDKVLTEEQLDHIRDLYKKAGN